MKQKPHYEHCSLCENLISETNFPKKGSERRWGMLCFRCSLAMEKGIQAWRKSLKRKPLERVKS